MKTFNAQAAAKALLTVYPLLEKFIESCQKANKCRALQSFYGLMDTQRLCEKIMNETYRFQRLEALKSDIEKLVESMPPPHDEILHFHYFDRWQSAKIAEMLEINKRSVFRRINAAVDAFSRNLSKLGINSFTFGTLLEQNIWIAREYERQLANHAD